MRASVFILYILFYSNGFLRILFRGVHFVQCFLAGFLRAFSQALSGLYILYSRFLLGFRKLLSVWCIYVTQSTETIHFVQSLRYYHFSTNNRLLSWLRLITRLYCKLTAIRLFYGYFTGFQTFFGGILSTNAVTVHFVLYIPYCTFCTPQPYD